MSDVKGQVVSGVKWSLFGKLVSQLFSWVVTFIVIRILTPNDYGIIELSTALITLGIALGVSGFSDVIVQKKQHDTKLCAQVFTLAIGFNGALFLLIFSSAGAVANWYDSPQLADVIRLLSLNILLLSFSVVPAGILKREMNFKRLSLIQMVQAFVNSLTTLTLALLGFEYWAIAFGSLIAMVTSVILLNIYSASHLRLTTDFSEFRSHFNFGMFTIINRLLHFIFLKADSFIIGKVLGTKSLGYYSVGSQLANLPLEKVAQTLNEVSFVGYAKVKEDRAATAYYYLQSSKIIALMAFSIFWGMASIAEPLINVLLGDKWLNAGIIFQLLALVMPFRIYQLATHSAIAGIGHPKFNTRNLMVLCVVIPSSVYIGLQWDLVGAALGWSLGYLLFFVWMIRRSLKFLSVQPIDFIRSILVPLCAGSLMLLVNFLLYQYLGEENSFTTLLCLILAGAVSFISVVLVFDKSSVVKLKNLLHK